MVARGVATLAGIPGARRLFRPRLQARLYTAEAPLYLSADLIGGEPSGSVASDAPALAAGPKVISEELGHVLEAARGSGDKAAESDVEHRV